MAAATCPTPTWLAAMQRPTQNAQAPHSGARLRSTDLRSMSQTREPLRSGKFAAWWLHRRARPATDQQNTRPGHRKTRDEQSRRVRPSLFQPKTATLENTAIAPMTRNPHAAWRSYRDSRGASDAGAANTRRAPARGCAADAGQLGASQRSLHNAPIFRLLLKVAVNGTHQCDFLNC